MAQTEKPTALGYAEIAKLVAGEAATEVESVQGLTGACAAAEASTFANPGGATKIVANGFDVQAADTVATSTTSVTDDTVEVDHVFTSSGTQSVTGFTVMNNDDDVVFMECCFAAAIATESGDTITIEAKMQFKLGA